MKTENSTQDQAGSPAMSTFSKVLIGCWYAIALMNVAMANWTAAVTALGVCCFIFVGARRRFWR